MRGAFLSPPHKTNWRQKPLIAGNTLLKYDYSWEKYGEKFGEFSFYCYLCGRFYQEFIF